TDKRYRTTGEGAGDLERKAGSPNRRSGKGVGKYQQGHYFNYREGDRRRKADRADARGKATACQGFASSPGTVRRLRRQEEAIRIRQLTCWPFDLIGQR